MTINSQEKNPNLQAFSQVELTEKAKENLRRNEESRKKESKYVRLQPGEKMTLHFDPEKMEPVDEDYDGKKTVRYRYVITDPNDSERTEKFFSVSKSVSIVIDSYLAEGRNILKVNRIGAGKDTQYVITPA